MVVWKREKMKERSCFARPSRLIHFRAAACTGLAGVCSSTCRRIAQHEETMLRDEIALMNDESSCQAVLFVSLPPIRLISNSSRRFCSQHFSPPPRPGPYSYLASPANHQSLPSS